MSIISLPAIATYTHILGHRGRRGGFCTVNFTRARTYTYNMLCTSPEGRRGESERVRERERERGRKPHIGVKTISRSRCKSFRTSPATYGNIGPKRIHIYYVRVRNKSILSRRSCATAGAAAAARSHTFSSDDRKS